VLIFIHKINLIFQLLLIFPIFAQVVLQSETIQELTKTSQTLGSLQEEASELRKLSLVNPTSSSL
jgi:hypothetical protein